MNKRQTAIISGISLILMAIIAGFSVGYAFTELYQYNQIDMLKDNVLNNQGLYKAMLLGILIILILDLLVSYTLYKYFETDNKKISSISSAIRIIYTVIFGMATFYLIKNLQTDEFTNKNINANFQQFQSIWNGGLIIFGVHILLIGILMKLHQKIPKILWYLTLFAGVSYIFLHILKLANSGSGLVMNLEMILALPMALGELGLAIWLLIKGGKDLKLINKTSR